MASAVPPETRRQFEHGGIDRAWIEAEPSLQRRIDQPLQCLRVRGDRAEEQHLVAAGHEQGRKVLNVDRTDDIGLVLDVDPHPVHARIIKGQQHLIEQLAIAITGAAPMRAQTGHRELDFSRWGWRGGTHLSAASTFDRQAGGLQEQHDAIAVIALDLDRAVLDGAT